MKFSNFSEKIKGLFTKLGHKGIIISCAVLLIGAAVLFNWIIFSGSPSNEINTAIDLSNLGETGASGQNGENASASASEDYFTTTVMSRQRARDEAIEVLRAVAENTEAVQEMKDKALNDISQIALDIEREANIETLIRSKGFEECVAVITGSSANIIVKTDGLLPNEVSQINEIVYEQAGILPADLKIIEKK